jgi:hypothetical protein
MRPRLPSRFASSPKGGARNAGPHRTRVPRSLATPRLVEEVLTRLRRNLGVPRAVFEACSAATPVGSPFFTHRYDAGRQPRHRIRECLSGHPGKPRLGPPLAGARMRPFAATAFTSSLALRRKKTPRGWRCCRRQIPPDGPAFVTLDRKRP